MSAQVIADMTTDDTSVTTVHYCGQIYVLVASSNGSDWLVQPDGSIDQLVGDLHPSEEDICDAVNAYHGV